LITQSDIITHFSHVFVLFHDYQLSSIKQSGELSICLVKLKVTIHFKNKCCSMFISLQHLSSSSYVTKSLLFKSVWHYYFPLSYNTIVLYLKPALNFLHNSLAALVWHSQAQSHFQNDSKFFQQVSIEFIKIIFNSFLLTNWYLQPSITQQNIMLQVGIRCLHRYRQPSLLHNF